MKKILALTILGLLLLSVFLGSTIIPDVKAYEEKQQIVAMLPSSWAFGTPFQIHSFEYGGYKYIMFHDWKDLSGNNVIGLYSSSDGQTWNRQQNVTTLDVSELGHGFSIWFDETDNYVYAIYTLTTYAPTEYQIYYKRGTPSGGNITWDPQRNVASLTSNQLRFPTITTFRTSGLTYIASSYTDDTTDTVHFFAETYDGGYQHSNETGSSRKCSTILTFNSSHLIVVYGGYTPTNRIKSVLWDLNEITTEINATNVNYDELWTYSVVSDNSSQRTHLIFLRDDEVEHWHHIYNGSSWSSGTVIANDSSSGNMGDVGILTNTRKIEFLYWNSSNILKRLEYNNTWSSPIDVTNETSGDINVDHTNNVNDNLNCYIAIGFLQPLYYVGATVDDSLPTSLVNVVSSPEMNVDWDLDATYSYMTPWSSNITQESHSFQAMDLTKSPNSSSIFAFDYWELTNVTGTFTFETATINLNIQTATNLTIVYEGSQILVSSSPEINADFTVNATAYTTPETVWRYNSTWSFVCTDFEIEVNSSYKYTFDHWTVNGSGYYGSLNINVQVAAATNLTIVYLGSHIQTPYVPDFAHDAVNGTWYFRSDTHTIHEQLSYKLDPQNSASETYDVRTRSGNYSVTYGVRVWVIDLFGNLYELSGGTPEATVSRTVDGAGILSAYFDCPAYSALIDAIQVNVYQRFGSESWSLRRYFRTQTGLYIKLPASTWTVYYYVNKTTSSTSSYYFHGSSSYASRVDLQYYRANPWEIALGRLQLLDFGGFLFTPWTYWLGDVFWAFLLFFGAVTGYGRTRSLKPILAVLWILGGTGSVLSLMLPMLVLRLAWVMLAVAMAITIFKLIWR